MMWRALIASLYVVSAFAAEISLPDSDGRMHSPLAVNGAKATVVVFLMQDCPVANAMAPELARIASDYGKQGVRFFGIYTTETPREVARHKAEYKLPFVCLIDADCRVAGKSGATRVPEAAVFGKDGKIAYLGRIDDRAPRPGVIRPTPVQRDLRNALDAVLAGKKPNPAKTEAIGCYLPLK